MMQYPPQQPTHPPSEVYMPEQPQPFTPTQETTQPPVAAREIAIYVNRRLAILRTAFFVISLFIIVLAIPALVIFSALSGVPLGLSDLAPLFLIVIPGTAFVGWVLWTMLSILLAHKPMLLINHEGIVVSSMPMLGGFSISWSEIEAIFPSRYMYKYLCIVPKTPDHYLKTHFNGFGRFNRQINSRVVGSPLYIPQINLDKRIEEILQQVSYMYTSELSYYHVQVRSYPQDMLS